MRDDEDLGTSSDALVVADPSLGLLSRASAPIAKITRAQSLRASREASLYHLVGKCLTHYTVVNKVLRMVIMNYHPEYTDVLPLGFEEEETGDKREEVLSSQTETMELLRVLIIATRNRSDEQDQLVWSLEVLAQAKEEEEQLESQERLQQLEGAVERLAETIVGASMGEDEAVVLPSTVLVSDNPMYNPGGPDDDLEEEEEKRGEAEREDQLL